MLNKLATIAPTYDELDTLVLDNIFLFIKLVEFESYTETANYFKTTKGTISRKIEALELYFNQQLLIRNPKYFQLTPAGESVYSEFVTLPQQLDRAYNRLNAQHVDMISGRLRVVLPPVLSSVLITPYLEYFNYKYPHIKLDILFSHEKIALGGYDIVVTIHKDIVDSQLYDFRLLRDEYVKFYCTPKYVTKYGLPLSINELEEHSLIGGIDLASGQAFPYINLVHKYTKDVARLNLLNSKINVTPANHSVQIGLQDNYIFWGYESNCTDLLRTGQVVSVLPDYHYGELGLYMITKRNITANEQLFVDFIYRCMNGNIKLDVLNSFDPQ